MKNRIAGFIIIGIAVLIGFIIFSFNQALTSIVSVSCSHGPSCPMWETINFETNISVGIMSFIFIIGLYLIFFGKEEKIITKIKTLGQQFQPKITRGNYQKIMRGLSIEEKTVFEKIIESRGSIFQSALVDKTNFNKVKITRILEKPGRPGFGRKKETWHD